MLSTSRYNFAIPVGEAGILLYNSRTGASSRYTGTDAKDLTTALCTYPARIDPDELTPDMLAPLLEGGFLTERDFDELGAVRSVFNRAKCDSPVIITITTTNNCNLGCFYCFQKRGESQLGGRSAEKVLELIRGVMGTSGKPSLHIDWYGGEPMLNRSFIEETSLLLQKESQTQGWRYSASMLTNGTLWPQDPLGFVRSHVIERLQITFDGFGATHNKVRRYRNGHAGSGDQFEEAVRLVDQLKESIVLDVRYNLSPQNKEDLTRFCQFGVARGWFADGSKAKLQLAKLTPYSKEVDFLRRVELTYREFEHCRDAVREIVPEKYLDRTAVLDRYPNPRESVCAAIAQDSVVIGADGSLYNCGLQVTEEQRSVGRLNGPATADQAAEHVWWDRFDPTKQEKCSKCSFLPLCWGACPKLHLEHDSSSLDQQSEFWRVMLPRRLAASLGLKLPEGFVLTEREQFKSAL